MHILIVANKKSPQTLDALFQIGAYLNSQGISYSQVDVSELPDSAFVYSNEGRTYQSAFNEGCDLILALGGDGTILHSARLAFVLDAPILGINFGHLGFLANKPEDGIIALLVDALAGEIMREHRMNLKVEVICEGDDEEPPINPRVFFAFNEIAIARGALGHIVDYEFSISGDKIATMRGDGLVVATATGSTAYSLSAGGPLVGPSHRGMIVVPLAPHTLNSRAIVAEHQDVVEVNFEEGSTSAREVSLFVDGDALEFERPIAAVLVSVSDKATTLLTCRQESFYKQIARTFFD